MIKEFKKTNLYWHEDIPLHDKNSLHSSMVAGRLNKIMDHVKDIAGIKVIEPLPIPVEDLLRAHSEKHIQALIRMEPEEFGEFFHIDNETVMTPHTMRTITLSAGAVINAINAVMSDSASNAFCLVYGGHHANSNRSHGFCFINNIAIGAMYLKARDARVAIVDFDTHSGDGTVLTVKDQENILFLETYQEGFPGKFMSDTDQPTNIHRKLVKNRDEWISAWKSLLPKLKAFDPEIILVSAGFDAHENDPLGTVGVKNEDYVWLTNELLAIQPKIVSSLEGGYSIEDTAECVKLHVEALSKFNELTKLPNKPFNFGMIGKLRSSVAAMLA